MMVCACVHVHVWCDAVWCGVFAMGSRWELPPREEVASAPAPRPYVPFEGRTTAQDAYVPKVLEDGGPTFGARRDTGAPPPERPYIPFEVSGVPGGQGGLGCVGVGRQGVVCACVCMCVDGCRYKQREGGKGSMCMCVLLFWCAGVHVWWCGCVSRCILGVIDGPGRVQAQAGQRCVRTVVSRGHANRSGRRVSGCRLEWGSEWAGGRSQGRPA